MIVLAIKKITIFGAIFFAESKANGIDKTIAIKCQVSQFQLFQSLNTPIH